MTRYPKDGKGSKWTVKELDAITKDWKGDAINDGGGLTGEVRTGASDVVSIAFRYGFKLHGKKVWHYCGTYPKDAISAIREVRDCARASIKIGVDPRVKKIADKIVEQNVIESIIAEDKQKIIDASAERAKNLSFQDLYDCWIKDGVARSDKNKYIIRSFNKHALPFIGFIHLKDLTEHDLRALYRKIIAAGIVATAVELSKDIGQMLRWAEKRKPWRVLMIDGNSSELVEILKLVPADYTKERTRKLSIEEILKLKTIFESLEQTYAELPNKNFGERPIIKASQFALWICLGSLCRIGELLMTEWKHVDFKKRTWFIPAANTKGERGKKRDQLVYLSDFTLDKFMQLKVISGDGKWVFPASSASKHVNSHVCIKSVSKQVGDRQIEFKSRTKTLTNRVNNNTLVLGEEEWTPHDLRRTGATMMQQLKVHRDIINLCQNHVIGTKVDRVYLLDEYADEKREAWCKLGDRLEAILNSTNIVSLKQA